MARRSKYPQELMDRGVRLALESGRPEAQVARDLGIGHEALRKRVRQAEADGGLRPDLPSSEEREEIRKLRKEVFELRRANEILKAASVFVCDRARRRPSEVSAFIDEHREHFGVEPICETLDVSASPYYQRATGERSARSVEDERLTARLREVHEQNFECHPNSRVIRT
jgi:transposase